MLIRPIAKRNGVTFTIVASLFIFSSVIALLSSSNNNSIYFPLFAGSLIIGIVLLIVGIVKINDVDYRFSLTNEGIHYFTSRGGFTILWQDIQRIDIPKINDGLELKDLPYIGIRLNQREHLINSASLATLSHMLLEQRALIMLTDPNSTLYGNADNMLYPNVKVTHKYQGLQAMFINRMHYLHDTLGYDIYFPEDDLDRSPAEFIALLRKFKTHCPRSV
ncbi:DUF2982 domain-containing protein [Moritella sp. Urea-trap-13]|uniref:DUF2982 domain-containing protein n=1 Tax=Moritella sp. Urea-trap-13 TaxID=2058327 RepID=UPI000C323482|nr:DUF2982 domain-containing protein [Moritella sp. Urea-trap-13]PKH06860.1 DUF2982 domain-containing protein [Moritella sp. Urea-trap-13]